MGNRSCGREKGATFPFIKISSIKTYNSNIINNAIVAWHLVFFQALPWNPKRKVGRILLFPCYKLGNIVTALTGLLSNESVDKPVKCPTLLAGRKSGL